jgi:hypothetical protein
MTVSTYMDVYGRILEYNNGIVIYIQNMQGFWKVLSCIWKVYICILKYNNIFLMINRCILKYTKVFESFFNAFGCIYSELHHIGSVFQCNSMHL